jgi:Electron transfer DM13
MKTYLMCLLLVSGLLMACKKESTIITSTKPAMDMVDTGDSSGNLLKYAGTFSNGPYGSIMGSVKIYENAGAYSLVLDSFTVNNGPDLHVYLSKEIQPLNFIDLGKLKSVSGTQVYSIPGIPDFMEFKYALIHCQQFDHLFGNANLQ